MNPPPLIDREPGDDYLRRLATFIRTNEKSLAEAGVTRRRGAHHPPASSGATSLLNPLGWFAFGANPSSVSKPLVFSTDTHHLFYVLMRLEASEYDVGTLDVHIESPSRPMSYVEVFPGKDKSDTLSLASFRSSLSVVSRLSLGGGWWSQGPLPTVNAELKYIYSSITKLPALSICAPGKHIIAELVNDPPGQNALPLDAFKNLQSLECTDIDPRTLLGWDRLAESLRSLRIKKSGLEDISDVLVGAVLDDQARRAGSTSRKRKRRIPKGPTTQSSLHSTSLPETVVEDEDGERGTETHSESGSSSPTPNTQLSALKWTFLKHLSLSDNSLTFLPAEPLAYLTSLTHLDLSSNLFVSVPPSLSALYSLTSLNLSDNMIDSVLGIYLNLGQVLSLNLSHNRLESLCGLERLHALERVDLRSNLIDESSEVGRLATLPNIIDVWVEGNPFVEIEEAYRISCFDYFWKEGKTITLDGTPPGFYERRNLTVSPPEQMSSNRTPLIAHSPPVVSVGHAHDHAHRSGSPPTLPTPPSSNPSPHLAPVTAVGVSGKPRRKQLKRIVDFEDSRSDSGSRATSHSRMRSEESRVEKRQVKLEGEKRREESHTVEVTGKIDQSGIAPEDSTSPLQDKSTKMTSIDFEGRSPRRSRHSRYQTEISPPGTGAVMADVPLTPSSLRKSRGATMSGKRRTRVSASIYEAPSSASDEEGLKDNGEAYRRRIEALKQDMGDGWLKVFSQSQMKGDVAGDTR
jgi:Leucine-rich repeat (LRR) protein